MDEFRASSDDEKSENENEVVKTMKINGHNVKPSQTGREHNGKKANIVTTVENQYNSTDKGNTEIINSDDSNEEMMETDVNKAENSPRNKRKTTVISSEEENEESANDEIVNIPSKHSVRKTKSKRDLLNLSRNSEDTREESEVDKTECANCEQLRNENKILTIRVQKYEKLVERTIKGKGDRI